jgi:hypothetical protein
MANIKFTLANGTVTVVPDTGKVWQGFILVDATSVDVGDSIGPGCGFATAQITLKETE